MRYQYKQMRLFIPGLAVAAIAYTALAFVDTSAAIQAVIALPGSAGLLAALWDVVKANIEHQHRLDEASAGNAFVLSATSHMAEQVFNRHVEFAEKYMEETNNGLEILFREGPTTNALAIAYGLASIRRKYVLWQTTDVTEFLQNFESALSEVGAKRGLLQDAADLADRAQVVAAMYDTFNKILHLQSLPDAPTPEIAIGNIIDRLRDHLGIPGLTTLRQYYLAEALKIAKKE